MSDAEHPETAVADLVEAPSAPTDDPIVALRARVAERRAAGEFSESLEAELDSHFRRIVHHRTNTDAGEELATKVSALNERLFLERPVVPTNSGVPGVSVMHKAINKAMARHDDVLYAQLQDFALVVREALGVLADGIRTPTTHRHGELLDQIEAVLSRLDSYERKPLANEAALGDIRRRLEALERAQKS